MTIIRFLSGSRKTAFSLWVATALGVGSVSGITINFSTSQGYTSGTILEGQPNTGTHWTRNTYSGNTAGSIEITSGTGIDREQAATTQVSTNSQIGQAIYAFTPSSSDLGGTFSSSSSILEYNFSVAMESDPTTNSTTIFGVNIGQGGSAQFALHRDGSFWILNGNGSSGGTWVEAESSMGGSTPFAALGGVYFTVSGQVNWSTKTYTVLVNGVTQTIAGPTASSNFGFWQTWASKDDFDICNYSPTFSNWTACSVCDIRWQVPVVYSAPIVITSGGTYSGNWESTTWNVPVIQIKTTQPVTIQNSNIKGLGPILIYAFNYPGINLTVKNCKAWGVNPNVAGEPMPQFITAFDFQNLVVENCYLEHTTGIRMTSTGKTSNVTAQILYNEVLDVDGRVSDGSGGYTTSNSFLESFAGFGAMHSLALAQIGWNKIINVPNQSRVEDTITAYQSSGTPSIPIQFFDNYVQGGFPIPCNSGTYSGTGINCGDGATTDTPSTCSAYVNAYNNVVVNYANAGMAVYAGNNNSFYDNLIYSSGLAGIDTWVGSHSTGGAIIYNCYNTPANVFFNNTATGNSVGWENPNYSVPVSGLRDYYLAGDVAGQTMNTWDNNPPVTTALELQQLNYYDQQVSQNGITIGPNW